MKLLTTLIMVLIFFAADISAQEPAVRLINYQGRLMDSTAGQPTNGPYTIRFDLFGTETAGQSLAFDTENVTVVNGIFTTRLDFGTAVFDGNPRWLEITVGTVVLTPRQPLGSVAYAIRSVTATNNVLKSGDTMSGVLNMGNNKIINLASPVNSTDGANKGYVDVQVAVLGDTKVDKAGDAMSGNLKMDGNDITVINSLGFVPLSAAPYACAAATAGALYYASNAMSFMYCTGNSWVTVGGSPTQFITKTASQQQQGLEQLQQQVKQQRQIDELKQIVCTLKPDAQACKEINK